MSFFDDEESVKEKGPDDKFRVPLEEAKRNFAWASEFKKIKTPLPDGIKIEFDKDKGDWILSMIWLSYRHPEFPFSFGLGVDRGVSLNQFHSSFRDNLEFAFEVVCGKKSGKLPKEFKNKEQFPAGKPINNVIEDWLKMKYGE